ncbi:MAG: outer membrane beta-barrel protein [Salinibacter sp.]
MPRTTIMGRWAALAAPLLLLSGAPLSVHAQDDGRGLSVGAEYTYVGEPQASGIGLTATKPIADRFGIGLQSNYFFAKHRTARGIHHQSEFDRRLWTVTLSLNVVALRFRGVGLYGTIGLQHLLEIEDGTLTFFNDVPPYGTTRVPIERTRSTGGVQLGGGVRIEAGVTFFAEPRVMLTDSAHFSLSSGLRVPI